MRRYVDPTPDELAARIWPRVADYTADECWPWPGARQPSGYAIFSYRSNNKVVTTQTHRLAYVLARGPIADGLEIDHLCNNRACINPSHMETVTHHENIRRAWRRRDAIHDAGEDCGGPVCTWCRETVRKGGAA